MKYVRVITRVHAGVYLRQMHNELSMHGDIIMKVITSFFPKGGAGSDFGETQSVSEELNEPKERGPLI